METKTSLVWAYRRVELYTVADVHLHLALVIYPWHTERYYTLWLYKALNELRLLKLRMLVVHILDREQHLTHCL